MDKEIPRSDFWGLTHYEYGEAYFGSHKGMRYRLALEPLQNVSRKDASEKEGLQLKASVWAAPFAYARTDPARITDHMFPFSEDGMNAAVAWFNDRYAAQKAEWEEALQ